MMTYTRTAHRVATVTVERVQPIGAVSVVFLQVHVNDMETDPLVAVGQPDRQGAVPTVGVVVGVTGRSDEPRWFREDGV